MATTTTTTTTAVGPNYMSIFDAPIMTAITTTGKSPSKAELAAEKRRLQSWARLLRSFRRHRRHHSPLYVLLSMRMDCAPAECLIDFDVVFMKCPEETTTEEPTAAAAAAEATKVNGKVKPRVKAEAIEADVGYCSSVNSSTSDYKSGDEMTTEEEEEEDEEKEEKKSEDENKKNKVDDAMTSYAVVQFTLGQPSSSEPSLSTSSNQVAFKAKTILDACTQMINFMAALDSLTTRYEKLEKAQRSMSFIIDDLREHHADVLQMAAGRVELVESKGKDKGKGKCQYTYWCQYELAHLGVFHSGVNYFPGPAKLAAAAKMVATLKAVNSIEEEGNE